MVVDARKWLRSGILAWALLLVGLVLPLRARAAQDSAEPAPRDIGWVAGSSPLSLGAPPADFQRIEQDGLTLEFPGSVRSRIEGLADEVDSSRARLSKDLGQSVLGSLLVRVAR